MADGKRNSAGAIMLALLAERARAETDETDRLRERINSGLAEARRKGVTLGRKVGKHDGAGSGAGSTQGHRAATQGRAEHPQRGYPDLQGSPSRRCSADVFLGCRIFQKRGQTKSLSGK